MADEGVAGPAAPDDATQIRTFLIADVRGYTLFTQERGDEAAGKLAAKFARIARECVEGRGGTLLELRGDEALCVFGSPRQAIRAAVELQERFVEETVSTPDLPLTVGIGLDAGEAVAVEGGYRGGALNLAARLCGEARAGETLASREVVHLARRVDGVRYEDRGALTLKGISEPVAVVRVVDEGVDSVQRLQPYAPVRPPEPRPHRRLWPVIAAAALAVLLIAVGLPILVSDDAGIQPEANSVAILDAASGQIRTSTELGARPGAIATGLNGTWVALPDRGRIVRLDPGDGEIVDTITVGASPSGIAIGDGSVWVTSASDGSVSRISPDANEVTAEIPAGVGPTGIDHGAGALWIADSVRNQLVRVDPTSGPTRAVDLPDRPDAVQYTPDGVWVTSAAASTVSRVDPASLEVTLSVTVGNGPRGVLPAFGSIWVANHLDGTVSRIHPATGRVTATISVGDGPHALAASDDAVWVANEYDASVVELDPAADPVEFRARLDVGASVGPLVADGEGIWMAVGESSTSHRGGTLRAVSLDGLDTLDPGNAYSNSSWSVLNITNDGLLGFTRSGGPEGLTVVPNLATTLPEISNDGRTYRFTLRSGVRYSNGEPVTAEDFRFAMERSFRLSDAAPLLFSSIQGAQECSGRPASCDLSEGIEVRGDDIVINLTEPEPDLPYLLTIPFAYPVPPRTPIEAVGYDPVPATGPYVIEAASRRSVVLVRNQEFRETAPAAQPDGFADRIELTFEEAEGDRFLPTIVEGDLDVLTGWVRPDAVVGFRTAHPDQLVQFTQPATMLVGLNPDQPPLDDERVRRAVNFAVDRARVQEMLGGETSARATCQILPPGFPGYEPYCPYATGPGGEWGRADLEEARRLVEEAGAVGAKVTYWTPAGGLIPGSPMVTRYVARHLERIGLDVEMHVEPDVGVYFGERLPHTDRFGIHMFDNGWFADIPGSSGYITPLFGCGGPGNYGGVCDEELEDAMARAQRHAIEDPATAHDAWAEVDRMLVDRGFAVPLVNTVSSNAFAERVGNAQIHQQWGVLLSRIWVR